MLDYAEIRNVCQLPFFPGFGVILNSDYFVVPKILLSNPLGVYTMRYNRKAPQNKPTWLVFININNFRIQNKQAQFEQTNTCPFLHSTPKSSSPLITVWLSLILIFTLSLWLIKYLIQMNSKWEKGRTFFCWDHARQTHIEMKCIHHPHSHHIQLHFCFVMGTEGIYKGRKWANTKAIHILSTFSMYISPYQLPSSLLSPSVIN